MHEPNLATNFEDSELINVGNGDALNKLVFPRESSDGLTPLRAPHTENYYGAIYPDMHPDLDKELADNDRRRYEQELQRRSLLGGLASSGY